MKSALFPCITLHDFSRPLRERADSRRYVGPYRWTPSAAAARQGRGFYLSRDRRAPAMLGLRVTLDSDRGRYRYNDCGDTFTALVATLPRGRGWLAGATMGYGMASFVDSCLYRDESDARLAARDAAERAAQEQAEYEAEESERLAAEDADSEDQETT